MNTTQYYMITFASTHGAISTKSYLGTTIPIVIMPTLREVSKSCGIAIRVAPEHIEQAKQLMQQGSIKDYHMYYIDGKEIEQIK